MFSVMLDDMKPRVQHISCWPTNVSGKFNCGPTLANYVETFGRGLINIAVIILYPSQLRVQVKYVRHEDDPGCCFVRLSFF